MGTVYRKTYTKPLPENAELLTRKGQPLARWKDAKAKTRTARVTIPAGSSGRVAPGGTWEVSFRSIAIRTSHS